MKYSKGDLHKRTNLSFPLNTSENIRKKLDITIQKCVLNYTIIIRFGRILKSLLPEYNEDLSKKGNAMIVLFIVVLNIFLMQC